MSTPATRRLSRAVRPMKTDFSSVTNVRPWRARRYSGAVVAVPPNSTSPDSSGSSPASDSSVVVFPAPLAPSRPTTSPGCTTRSMSWMTGCGP